MYWRFKLKPNFQRTGLQVDHIQPFALRGSNEHGSLRCLCGAHNLHEARKQLGEEFMESKIQRQGIFECAATMQLIRAYKAMPSGRMGESLLEHG